MKLLVMCEGPNEKKIIEMLLENNCLPCQTDNKECSSSNRTEYLHGGSKDT